mmetsp:Transcript_88855/g.141490  ORF Transcript_88855/g.141490 Transcript_88855/m.141490 type:complete len:138 (-) Transcript_88855:88-501(-)
MPPGGGGGGGKRGCGGNSKGGQEGKRSGGRGASDKDAQSTRSADDSNGEAQAQRFNAQEAAEWISNRYQAVMEEYEKQKQTGKKDIQNFTDLNSDRPVWGGGAKPVLPGKEDFLQQLQTALLHFQRARQMAEEGKGN